MDKPVPSPRRAGPRGPRRRHQPGALLPRRQHHGRAHHDRADARRGADAVLPDRRQGRRPRAAAGRRGHRRRLGHRAAPGRAHRTAAAPSSSTSGRSSTDERPRADLPRHGTRARQQGNASSSSATAWPARAPSRRSSPAAAPSSSRSPCSATSRTATTTASCSSNVLDRRAGRRRGHLPQPARLVRGERHHPARRGAGHADRPVRARWSSPTTVGHALRQADHRHRQPAVRAADGGDVPPGSRGDDLLPGVFAFRTLDDSRAMIALRPARRAPQGGRHRRRSARPGGRPRAADATGSRSTSSTSAQHADERAARGRRRRTSCCSAASSGWAFTVHIGTVHDRGPRRPDKVARRRAQGRHRSWPATSSSSPPASARTSSSAVASGLHRGARDRRRRPDAHRATTTTSTPSASAPSTAAQVYGLVAPLWEQAKVLADQVTGADADAAYLGSRIATKLKVAGRRARLDGRHRSPRRDTDETSSTRSRPRGVYKKRRHPRRPAHRRDAARRPRQGRLPRCRRSTAACRCRERRAELLFDLGGAGGRGRRSPTCPTTPRSATATASARAPSCGAVAGGGKTRRRRSWTRRAPARAAASCKSARRSRSSSGRRTVTSRRTRRSHYYVPGDPDGRSPR